MMTKSLVDTVLELAGKEKTYRTELEIQSCLNQILSYLNRNDVSEEMFPVVCFVISDMLNSNINAGNIHSLSEGDMSISYFAQSPFFGKLESFKVIKGID